MDTWCRTLPLAQQRVVEELLAWRTPRPAVDPDLAPRLRRRLETMTRAAAAAVPAGERLSLGKSALAALDCDGRFLDRHDTRFAYTPSMVRGQLAHEAITLDMAGRRSRDPVDVVAHAWRSFSAGGGPATAFLQSVEGVEADGLRNAAMQLMLEFRDTFPLLPERVPVRAEPGLGVTLHGGRISLFGRPDFVLGRVQRRQRRMLLLDLKSGRGNVSADREELRFYALVATLKYGVAPFRTATFYLDEASWDAEDVDEDLLVQAATGIARKAVRAATLTFARPAEPLLQLTPGAACRWCTRAPACPAVRPRAAAA